MRRKIFFFRVTLNKEMLVNWIKHFFNLTEEDLKW